MIDRDASKVIDYICTMRGRSRSRPVTKRKSSQTGTANTGCEATAPAFGSAELTSFDGDFSYTWTDNDFIFPTHRPI